MKQCNKNNVDELACVGARFKKDFFSQIPFCSQDPMDLTINRSGLFRRLFF